VGAVDYIKHTKERQMADWCAQGSIICGELPDWLGTGNICKKSAPQMWLLQQLLVRFSMRTASVTG